MINVVNGATLSIGSLTLNGQKTGTLISSEGTLNINSGAVIQNSKCSAISVSGGKLTVDEGTTFTTNRVDGSSDVKGGAISATGGEVEINGGSFTTNAAGMGGALYVGGSAQVTINDGEFSGNGNMYGAGGAIYVDGGSLDIAGGTLTGNMAGYPGIYANNGGAIAVMGGNVSITGGEIYNNSAAGVGNGVYIAPGANVDLAGSGTSGITDSFGIGYDENIAENGTITVEGKVDHQVNVQFADPEKQAQEGVVYVISEENTSQELKEEFRVTNPGYTFKPVDDPQGGTGALELVKSETVVAVVEIDGSKVEFTSIQAAIDAASEADEGATVYLVKHDNEASGNTSNTITVNETIVVKGNITFGTIERHVASDGVTVTYPNEGSAEVTLIRGESLTEEMICVEEGASLSLGGANNGNITLDGGAKWTDGKPTVSGGTGAGDAQTGNTGITAHTPIIVNQGELTIADGATLQNNDNNYAAPGEGFGSENYGGGIRNEGAGSLTISGGTIQNNASQMKGSAIQTIYGGATTTIAGGTIQNNVSMSDMGSLSVEEGGKLTVSGGSVSVGENNENAIYIYNQYSKEDVSGAAEGETPYIEGENAAQLVVSGTPVINGNIHLDDPCEVADKDKTFAPVIDANGYAGNALNVSVESTRPWGEIAKRDLADFNISGLPEQGEAGESNFLYEVTEADGSKGIYYGGYDVEVTVNEQGGVTVTGSAALPAGEKLVVTIGGKDYVISVGENGQLGEDGSGSFTVPASDLLYHNDAVTDGAISASVSVVGADDKKDNISELPALKVADAVSGELGGTGLTKDPEGAEDNYTLTFDGVAGLEYGLLDKNGAPVAWATAGEDGKVSFPNLKAESEDYTLVVREPAQSGTLPGPYTEIGNLTAQLAKEDAKKAVQEHYEDILAKADENGIDGVGEIDAIIRDAVSSVGSLEYDPDRSLEDQKAAVDAIVDRTELNIGLQETKVEAEEVYRDLCEQAEVPVSNSAINAIQNAGSESAIDKALGDAVKDIIDSLVKDGDSDAVKAIAEQAKQEAETAAGRGSYDDLQDIVTEVMEALDEQRNKEKEEA